ncbi:thioesterase family protein [Breoghania sp.]|uniref:acyl-CoA thioesterase n=1 Tax=Breoghania sp. TaxID=2065378 RepID=UPI0029CA9232|nr:thioesterase family protein [Breoghania sp.]
MLISSRVIQIEWGDCDPAGIVWYPRYFGMFDACTAGLFHKATGLKKIELIEKYDFVGFPMVDTQAKFMIPSAFGDEIRIDTSVTELGRSSFNILHKVMKGDKLAIEATEKRVWVGKHPDDPARIKSKAIPEEVVAALKG